MTDLEPLRKFGDVKKIIARYDLDFGKIDSPYTIYEKKTASVRARITQTWRRLASSPSEAPKLQEEIVELGGQLRELEINHKANIQNEAMAYEEKLRATMTSLCRDLIQTIGPTRIKTLLQIPPNEKTPQNGLDGSLNGMDMSTWMGQETPEPESTNSAQLHGSTSGTGSAENAICVQADKRKNNSSDSSTTEKRRRMEKERNIGEAKEKVRFGQVFQDGNGCESERSIEAETLSSRPCPRRSSFITDGSATLPWDLQKAEPGSESYQEPSNIGHIGTNIEVISADSSQPEEQANEVSNATNMAQIPLIAGQGTLGSEHNTSPITQECQVNSMAPISPEVPMRAQAAHDTPQPPTTASTLDSTSNGAAHRCQTTLIPGDHRQYASVETSVSARPRPIQPPWIANVSPEIYRYRKAEPVAYRSVNNPSWGQTQPTPRAELRTVSQGTTTSLGSNPPRGSLLMPTPLQPPPTLPSLQLLSLDSRGVSSSLGTSPDAIVLPPLLPLRQNTTSQAISTHQAVNPITAGSSSLHPGSLRVAHNPSLANFGRARHYASAPETSVSMEIHQSKFTFPEVPTLRMTADPAPHNLSNANAPDPVNWPPKFPERLTLSSDQEVAGERTGPHVLRDSRGEITRERTGGSASSTSSCPTAGQQEKEVERAEVAPEDWVRFEAQHEVWICLKCRTAIRPGKGCTEGFTRHFRNQHQLKGRDLVQLISHCSGRPSRDPHVIELPPDGGAPVDGLPMLPGYRCTVCEYRTINKTNMIAHRSKSSHPSDRSGWESVTLQSFSQGSFARYWIVETAARTRTFERSVEQGSDSSSAADKTDDTHDDHGWLTCAPLSRSRTGGGWR